MANNGIGFQGGVKALFANLKLTTLCLRGNDIGPLGMQFAALYKREFALLDVSSNNIGDDGAKAAARCKIGTLYIGGNQITDLGATFLHSNPNIKSLYAKGNKATFWEQKNSMTQLELTPSHSPPHFTQ